MGQSKIVKMTNLPQPLSLRAVIGTQSVVWKGLSILVLLCSLPRFFLCGHTACLVQQQQEALLWQGLSMTAAPASSISASTMALSVSWLLDAPSLQTYRDSSFPFLHPWVQCHLFPGPLRSSCHTASFRCTAVSQTTCGTLALSLWVPSSLVTEAPSSPCAQPNSSHIRVSFCVSKVYSVTQM